VQPQLTGDVQESHVSQQSFLPQCQWANHDFRGLLQQSVTGSQPQADTVASHTGVGVVHVGTEQEGASHAGAEQLSAFEQQQPEKRLPQRR
jgi:hypothetical protein